MEKLIFRKDNIGLGKRKQAIARVFIVPGSGNLTINKVSGNQNKKPTSFFRFFTFSFYDFFFFSIFGSRPRLN